MAFGRTALAVLPERADRSAGAAAEVYEKRISI